MLKRFRNIGIPLPSYESGMTTDNKKHETWARRSGPLTTAHKSDDNPVQMAPENTLGAGETIGQRLKRLRLERGLSQRELAAPGVSYAYISRIEAGTRQPSVKALRKLAAKLGVSADFLETGSELDPAGARELRLTDLELAVRLGESDGVEKGLEDVLIDAIAAADAPVAFRARVALAALRETAEDMLGAIAYLEAAVADEPFRPADTSMCMRSSGGRTQRSAAPQQAVELFERCLETPTANAPPQRRATRRC